MTPDSGGSGTTVAGVVRATVTDHVLTLVLNRPEKSNAFNTEMVEAVTTTIHYACGRDDIRALVIAGEGPAFAAGADISEYADATADQFRRFTEAANDMCTAIASLPVPVIAAVDGVALGGGFEVVLCCDLVIAGPRASFGLPETSLGLIPGWGGTQVLSGLIGTARTKSLVFTGARLSAQEAYDLGLVHQLCVDGDALSSAEQLATSLAGRATSAIAAAKRAISASAPTLGRDSDGHSMERAELLALFDTDESREGIAAFVGKRKPDFSGNRTGPRTVGR